VVHHGFAQDQASPVSNDGDATTSADNYTTLLDPAAAVTATPMSNDGGATGGSSASGKYKYTHTQTLTPANNYTTPLYTAVAVVQQIETTREGAEGQEATAINCSPPPILEFECLEASGGCGDQFATLQSLNIHKSRCWWCNRGQQCKWQT